MNMPCPKLVFLTFGFRRLPIGVAAFFCGGWLHTAFADDLLFNKIVADTYHAPVNRGGSFRIVTDGVVNTTDSFRGFDTFNGNTGNPVFAGLIQTGIGAAPQVFETVTLSLGNPFIDGGDFSANPNLYLLISNTDTNTLLPSLSADWVQVTTASLTQIGASYQFTLSGTPAERTAWGFAVGGVQGSGTVRFVSVSELSATGTTARLPMGSPTNVVSSVYHAPDTRAAALTLAINGDVSPGGGFDNNRDWDTFEGVIGQTKTDFGGLLYSSLQQFDTLTLSYGTRFGDGGRFATAPRLFLNITGVDTNTSLPENDPINWLEVFGGTLVREFDGETFDLTGLPLEQRQGFGWAIGGVNGDGNTSPTPQNFISISELSASGVSIPEPSATLFLASGGLLFLRRRAKTAV
jgi:hypothetical protein